MRMSKAPFKCGNACSAAVCPVGKPDDNGNACIGLQPIQQALSLRTPALDMVQLPRVPFWVQLTALLSLLAFCSSIECRTCTEVEDAMLVSTFADVARLPAVSFGKNGLSWECLAGSDWQEQNARHPEI